jgi:hypothetical protein
MTAETIVSPTHIERSAVYIERSASIVMRVPASTLARARREGAIRYSRRGKSIYYLGEWLIDWLLAGEDGEARTPKSAGLAVGA